MRAVQCFTYEFWDLDTKPLDTMVPEKDVMENLIGGWCVLLPEQTRICHVRWCASPCAFAPCRLRFSRVAWHRVFAHVVDACAVKQETGCCPVCSLVLRLFVAGMR